MPRKYDLARHELTSALLGEFFLYYGLGLPAVVMEILQSLPHSREKHGKLYCIGAQNLQAVASLSRIGKPLEFVLL